MKITVKEQGYATVMNEDGEFKCPHENIVIEKPCCSSTGSSGYIECGCRGLSTVYCEDCDSEDLTDWESSEIMENYY